MLTTITFRYLGTVLQFVVLAVVARSVTQDDYGLYLLCLSFSFSLYYFLGLGASESALARLARALAAERDVEAGLYFGTVLGLTAVCAIPLIAVAILISVVQPWASHTNSAIVFTLVFLIANGLMFNISQLLLGLRYTRLGSFFFYPSVNLVLLCSTVPTALLLASPNFSHLSIATALGASLASASALLICMAVMPGLLISWSTQLARTLIKEGFGLTGLRILHVSSFWIPTMVSGMLLSAANAGVMGTAGRLAIAVSAVIAAIRFFIRPVINHALELKQFEHLKSVMGAVATLTTFAGVGALVANELVGEQVIVFFFGSDLRAVAPLLSILLISVVAEAIFGPVDELLKAAGHQKVVGMIYGIGVLVFLIGSIIVAHWGLAWIGWLQVCYVFGIFLAMNLLVKQKLGFVVLPSWPTMNDLQKLK